MPNPVPAASGNNAANLGDLKAASEDAISMQNAAAKASSEEAQAAFQKSMVDMLNAATKSAGESMTKVF